MQDPYGRFAVDLGHGLGKVLQMAQVATVEDFEQSELITDDDRVPAEMMGPLQLLRAFRDARKQYGDLISRPLAAEIIGVSTSQLCVWINRGRLTDVRIGPVSFVVADEAEALWEERAKGGFAVGGRGKKLPSMADIVRLGSKIGN